MDTIKIFELKGEAPNMTLVKYHGKIDNVIAAVLGGEEKKITVPDGVASIGGKAFAFSDVTDVVLSEGVKTICGSAFIGALALKTVSLPSTLTAIKEYAFASSSLESVTLPPRLKTIENGAFESTSITSVIIPPSVTSIGERAFAKCDRLTKVYIPSTVNSMSLDVFKDCDNLTIYLSGELPENWPNKFETVEETVYNDGYAFDFHRGGVSGGYFETVTRTKATSFNPDRCKVVPNTSLEEFLKL